jgi:hypothetical protein
MPVSNKGTENAERRGKREVFMKGAIFSSPKIAQEMQRIYGTSTKVVRIKMRHEEEVRNYVMKIEEAHKKAAKSKLNFR